MVDRSGLSLNKCQSRLSQGVSLEIPEKLLKPTFLPSPYIAHTPHAPINSSPFPGLAHWTDYEKGLCTGVQSRLDPCPQRTNERHVNKIEKQNYSSIY